LTINRSTQKLVESKTVIDVSLWAACQAALHESWLCGRQSSWQVAETGTMMMTTMMKTTDRNADDEQPSDARHYITHPVIIIIIIIINLSNWHSDTTQCIKATSTDR